MNLIVMTNLYILNGPDKGKSFDLKDDLTYIGRSSDVEVQINDQTVSRRHLKIIRRGKKYFVTDLKSQKGTFFNGDYIAPGLEIEAKEGVPIAVGMSVICLGEGYVNESPLEKYIYLLSTLGYQLFQKSEITPTNRETKRTLRLHGENNFL
jgi:pSer/pThr/pTyr-binding forkhead associated (FHA) protein